jgi:hypothetical protein
MKIDDIVPYLSGVGFTLSSLDADDTGAEDIAGQFMLYAGEAFAAVSMEMELPPLPETISGVAVGKLGGVGRGVLFTTGTVLTILQFQVMASKPKLGKVLRYISQGISAILAGRALPAAPVV